MPQPITPTDAESRESVRADGRDPRPALALIYAAKFGHLGIVMPFLAPWLLGRGFGPAAIGFLLALAPLFKIVAPWSWGRWADRSGRRRELLLVAACVAALALAGMVASGGPVALVVLITLYSFARAPILPYVEATSLEQSERRRFAYGPIRLWGSLAFVLTASSVGAIQSWMPLGGGLLLAGAMLALCGLLAPALPPPLKSASSAGSERPRGLPDRVGLVRFLAGCALMQVSHGAYYTFFSIHLQQLGYGATVIGGLWALAVICEILLFTKMDRVVERFGNPVVLIGCLLLACARWLLFGTVTALPWLAVGQTLHAFTYAAFHVVAIRVVYRWFGPGQRARGQAMYSGMTFGMGVFLGSLGAGWLVGLLGLPRVFQVSAGVALLAVVVLGRTARGEPRQAV